MRGSKREGGGGRFRLRSDGTTMALSLSLSPFNGSLTVNVTSPLDLPPPTEDELFGCGSCLVTFFIVGGKGCSLLHKHSSPSSSHPFPILSPFPSHLIRKAGGRPTSLLFLLLFPFYPQLQNCLVSIYPSTTTRERFCRRSVPSPPPVPSGPGPNMTARGGSPGTRKNDIYKYLHKFAFKNFSRHNKFI